MYYVVGATGNGNVDGDDVGDVGDLRDYYVDGNDVDGDDVGESVNDFGMMALVATLALTMLMLLLAILAKMLLAIMVLMIMVWVRIAFKKIILQMVLVLWAMIMLRMIMLLIMWKNMLAVVAMAKLSLPYIAKVINLSMNFFFNAINGVFAKGTTAIMHIIIMKTAIAKIRYRRQPDHHHHTHIINNTANTATNFINETPSPPRPSTSFTTLFPTPSPPT